MDGGSRRGEIRLARSISNEDQMMWWSRWKREEGEKAESETVFKEDGN